MSQAKERGGLGVGNLVKRNEVRANSLWYAVFWSKFWLNENDWDPKPGARGPSWFPWTKGFDLFVSSCCFGWAMGE